MDVPAHAPLCAAPDRHPRPPRTPFPPLACDTHAHVFGPAARFPYVDERIYTPPDSTYDDYRALLAALGVKRAVLVQPSVYGADNAAMLAALAAFGTGVRAVAVTDPAIAPKEIEALHRAGVRGLRFNVVDRRDNKNVVPVDALRAVAAKIAPFGWHIELLVNVDEAPDFAAAVSAIPVPVVLGHLGYPKSGARNWTAHLAFAALLRLLDGGRCWIKLTGPYRISDAPDVPYEDVDAPARALIAAAPQRMIWGTDWPHAMKKKRMANDGEMADLLERWAPDAAVRRRILADNPAELYGFAPGETIS
ncbi:MAG: GntR family transcriptional regulator [Alphaproteobacteria bacterium]|nr:GntR family transcriptional regulator [Alphaproteobacteria bacterium]